jgi:multidrug efflux pump subunit AcrB
MWIVRLALRNPYSVAVFAALILILGVMSIGSMLIDIFPVIDLPVVGVVWNYPGLSPEEMERRVVLLSERAMSTTVSGIVRIESESMPGIGNIRAYFEPTVPIGSAVAQISAVSETILRFLPPGMTPPAILPFNASNVPVAQLTVTSKTVPEEKLYDYATNFIKLRLLTIPGLASPAPYGGKVREINVDVDPALATSKGVSAEDIANTLVASNLIIPAGTARIGQLQYNVITNSSPLEVKEFNEIPVKVVAGRPVLLGEVSHVSDSYADQTQVVRINGVRGTYLNILKKAESSSIRVVDGLRKLLPVIKAVAPPGMDMKVDFDQTVFVRAAVSSVVREAMISGFLVSLMVLFFLGSWRSVIIVVTSIPLSIFASIVFLKMTGQSLNLMTLGGLALAVGMLVDDATVEIENINRNNETASSVTVAILRAASQIALPAIVSTLAICIVFFPIGLLTGPAKFLFTPMAEAVVFAMLASYVLSRTLVPVLARLLIKDHRTLTEEEKNAKKSWLAEKGERFNEWRENWLHHVQERYGKFISVFMHHRMFSLAIFALLFCLTAIIPFTIVGSDFFPASDAGLMKLHFRAPNGMRIENAEQVIQKVEERIKDIIPAKELETINSTIGPPVYYNYSFVPSDNVSPMDAEILISLKADHQPVDEYTRKIRASLTKNFPGSQIYFQSADMVNQVLNFGLSAPIDIQIEAPEIDDSYKYAKNIRDQIKKIPGAVDVNIKQEFNYPTLLLNVDRVRAAELGIQQRDVASSLLVSLSSTSLFAPTYYVNPRNNVNYNVAVKVPLQKIASTSDLLLTPITSATQNPITSPGLLPSPLDVPQAPTQTVGNLGQLVTETQLNEISHLNGQRVVDVTAAPEDRDLGAVIREINQVLDKLQPLPKGVFIHVRGQYEVMKEAFTKLGLGIILAAVLVYLLMVTLFQSWLDPFVIMAAVPGALIGILWMLAFTGTTLNVESLMGTIMAVGIAVSNSNLLVVFANEIRIEKNLSAAEAAIEAGKTRLRPVFMTALAMILGMIPMALAFGEGGEQNAPLGRAVIGGLIVATGTTLFIVPILYAVLRTELPSKYVLQEHFKQQEAQYDLEEAQAKKVAV